jgi:hypothetical protein
VPTLRSLLALEVIGAIPVCVVRRALVDADEAQIVRRIFELYLHGHQGAAMGCKSIAYFLNERGITRRGQRWMRARP